MKRYINEKLTPPVGGSKLLLISESLQKKPNHLKRLIISGTKHHHVAQRYKTVLWLCLELFLLAKKSRNWWVFLAQHAINQSESHLSFPLRASSWWNRYLNGTQSERVSREQTHPLMLEQIGANSDTRNNNLL